MMASKAALFQDQLTLDHIMSTVDPSDHQNLGRQVANFDSAAWDTLKMRFVLMGNYQKFRQNPTMCDELLATGNKVGREFTAECVGGRTPTKYDRIFFSRIFSRSVSFFPRKER